MTIGVIVNLGQLYSCREIIIWMGVEAILDYHYLQIQYQWRHYVTMETIYNISRRMESAVILQTHDVTNSMMSQSRWRLNTRRYNVSREMAFQPIPARQTDRQKDKQTDHRTVNRLPAISPNNNLQSRLITAPQLKVLTSEALGVGSTS